MTLQKLICCNLLAAGCTETEPTKKYRVFIRANSSPSRKFFVGKMGALRAGNTIAGSMSLASGKQAVAWAWRYASRRNG